jgi:hypothetical protein
MRIRIRRQHDKRRCRVGYGRCISGGYSARDMVSKADEAKQGATCRTIFRRTKAQAAPQLTSLHQVKELSKFFKMGLVKRCTRYKLARARPWRAPNARFEKALWWRWALLWRPAFLPVRSAMRPSVPDRAACAPDSAFGSRGPGAVNGCPLRRPQELSYGRAGVAGHHFLRPRPA